VSLSLLCDRIQDFFRSKGFQASGASFEDGYLIAASTIKKGRVNVKIVGDPDDFTVELYTEESSEIFVRIGALISIFGGGAFLLRGIKSKELFAEIEEDFWKHVEEAIPSSRSTGSSSKP